MAWNRKFETHPWAFLEGITICWVPAEKSITTRKRQSFETVVGKDTVKKIEVALSRKNDKTFTSDGSIRRDICHRFFYAFFSSLVRIPRIGERERGLFQLVLNRLSRGRQLLVLRVSSSRSNIRNPRNPFHLTRIIRGAIIITLARCFKGKFNFCLGLNRSIKRDFC